MFSHVSFSKTSNCQGLVSQDIVIPGSLDLIEVIAALETSKPLPERRFLTAFFGRADLAPWAFGDGWDTWENLGHSGFFGLLFGWGI